MQHRVLIDEGGIAAPWLGRSGDQGELALVAAPRVQTSRCRRAGKINILTGGDHGNISSTKWPSNGYDSSLSTHTVADAKNRLPELIDRALEGEDIVITSHTGQWLSSRTSRATQAGNAR